MMKISRNGMALERNESEIVNLKAYIKGDDRYRKLLLYIYEENKRGYFAIPNACRKAVMGDSENKAPFIRMLTELSSDGVIFRPTVLAYKIKAGRYSLEFLFPGLAAMNLKISYNADNSSKNRSSSLIAINPAYLNQMEKLKNGIRRRKAKAGI